MRLIYAERANLKEEKPVRKFFCRVSFLAIFFMLNACSSNKVIEWREETKLSNGQVVVVERKSEYRSVYPGGTGSDWLFVRERIKTTLLGKDVVWEGTLQPLAIDVSNQGEIYFVAVVYSMPGRYEYGIPQGQDHAAFKFDGKGNWTRIPVDTVPREIKPNMLIDEAKLYIDKVEPTDRVLGLGRKEKLNAENYYGESYRRWPTK